MNLNNEYLEAAREIAIKAGRLLLEKFPMRLNLNVQERGVLMDDSDREVHNLIYNKLNLRYPKHSFISVFMENQTFHNDRPLWIIDPIVGLGNFGHGDPSFALSIAYAQKGIVKVAVIYNPIFGQMFTAVRGGGAYLNGEKIHVSKTTKLQDSLLSTRFPYDIRTSDETNLEVFNTLILKAESVRNNATATLDMAYVASGQYDGFWAVAMNPWDLAAAALLISEAGGKVSGLEGEDYQSESKNILVTNGLIHDQVLETISSMTMNNEKGSQTVK